MKYTTPSFLFLGILSSSIATSGGLFCCFLCSLLLQSFRKPFTALLRSQTIISSLLAFTSTSCSSFPILFPLISAHGKGVEWVGGEESEDGLYQKKRWRKTIEENIK
uniref:Uncharacterized protein n=1 Tax=Solanum lycopersicum TaxID=4081 RepID=K4CWM0_SOLLC